MTDRNKFFYAHADIDLYDSTIGLTVPHYELIHQALVEVIAAHGGKSDIQHAQTLTCDLGAGTGKESQAILDLMPQGRVVAVDISEPMRLAFESRMLNRYGSLERVGFVVKDILADDLLPQLADRARSLGAPGYDYVISAYTIHHFDMVQKRKAYQLMYDLLRPGGLLINIDLFSYSSGRVSQAAHDYDMAYIRHSFENPPALTLNTPGVTKDRLKKLGEEWLQHMVKDNVLHSTEVQLELMRDIGFHNSECIFRYWQQGLLRAERPD